MNFTDFSTLREIKRKETYGIKTTTFIEKKVVSKTIEDFDGGTQVIVRLSDGTARGGCFYKDEANYLDVLKFTKWDVGDLYETDEIVSYVHYVSLKEIALDKYRCVLSNGEEVIIKTYTITPPRPNDTFLTCHLA